MHTFCAGRSAPTQHLILCLLWRRASKDKWNGNACTAVRTIPGTNRYITCITKIGTARRCSPRHNGINSSWQWALACMHVIWLGVMSQDCPSIHSFARAKGIIGRPRSIIRQTIIWRQGARPQETAPWMVRIHCGQASGVPSCMEMSSSAEHTRHREY